MKKIAVYPLFKENSAYFRITRECLEDLGVELLDFTNIDNKFSKYENIDAVFLNFYEGLYAKKPLMNIKKFIKAFLKIHSINVLKKKKVNIVYTIHNKESHDKKGKRLTSFVTRHIINKSDFLIALCKETYNYLHELDNSDYLIRKTIYIPHPEYSSVYTNEHYIDYRNKIGISNDSFVILLFGMIRPYKNIELFIDVAKMCGDKNMFFVLAGDGNDKNYVNKIRGMVDNATNICFINEYIKDDEMYSLFSASNVLCLPYQKGSLNSGPVIAALTFGIPVISPDIGSIHDYRKEYFFTYNYLNDDDHKINLYNSILKSFNIFFNEKEKYKIICKEMQEDVKKNASVEVIKKRYKELYRKMFENS